MRTEFNIQTGQTTTHADIPVSLTPDEINAPILAQLAANDAKIVRAIAEGDTARIAAHNAAQAALRAQLV